MPSTTSYDQESALHPLDRPYAVPASAQHATLPDAPVPEGWVVQPAAPAPAEHARQGASLRQQDLPYPYLQPPSYEEQQRTHAQQQREQAYAQRQQQREARQAQQAQQAQQALVEHPLQPPHDYGRHGQAPYQPEPRQLRTTPGVRRQTLTHTVAWMSLVCACVALVAVAANLRTHPATVAAPAGAALSGGGMVMGSSGAAQQTAPKVPTEAFKRVDPTVPAVSGARIKHFTVQSYEHVTKVSDTGKPVRVWSFAVNGVAYRGSGASPPIVVNQDDIVDVTFKNGGSKHMQVGMPHSLDFHSALVPPSKYYTTIGSGQSMHYRFKAEYAGVFLYHCATEPMLQHLGAGMVGMMIVKPRHLKKVDQEFWIMQQEYYANDPTKEPDIALMSGKQPDVVAFNGYGYQYRNQPIRVHTGEHVRVYVLNAGPSLWSAFHVIGSVFDKTVIEGQIGGQSQTVSLSPAQGGYVEFQIGKAGAYPFVTHNFADMGKGAMGAFITQGVPTSAAMM